MNVLSRKILIVLGLTVLAAAIAMAIISQSGSPTVDVRSSGFPACSQATGTGETTPCAVAENGEIYVIWDDVKFKMGSPPTPIPIPYKAQSIHPGIVAQALKEGIVLDIDDYDEVYVGIIHNHFPLECDGDLFCSEAWYHRFDSDRYPDQFNSAVQMQKHGINYIQVDGVWYIDGLDQLYQPTPIAATPTTAPISQKK